ncbi:hypothetical protein P692DRAFT_20721428 [Suillus brevipes Sb2]|nr:hypothetical protein P692DRAFT_20721428 [Suillus brevipes Sb2]
MEAFDFAFVLSNSDPNIINLLLLIKAIALFNAGRHNDAVRRVQDLTSAASQHSNSIPCGVVNSYLRVQLAISAFQDGRYSEAADQLDRSVPSVTNLFSSRALFEPRLKIFTVLFGWDLDSLWQTVNKIRCEACLCADRVIEAVESHQHMMSMIDDVTDSDLEWSIAFKKDCTARCIAMGNEAVAVKNYETAIELYSAGIELDSSCESLFVQRCKANSERNLFVAALHDANRVIKLNPSSYLGYQLKSAALHSAVRCNEVEEAFEVMFSKLDDVPDAQIRRKFGKLIYQLEDDDLFFRAAALCQYARHR